MVINRVNPAMITYRNMPKSPEKSNDADVKKASAVAYLANFLNKVSFNGN